MEITLEIIEAVRARLAALIPAVAVEYFPEKPDEYRLNHPRGALLISYLGGRFDNTDDTGFAVQPRAVRLSITIVMRELHGRTGAVEMLDVVRRALVGFKPPHCTKKIRAERDAYIGQVAGVWQYAVDVVTETMQVEDAEVGTEPLLTVVTTEEVS